MSDSSQTTMKGMTLPGDRTLVFADIPVPEPGPGEVRIRTMASAICGTDLHYYRATAEARADAASLATGHEPVGIVEKVGEGVVWPAVGERVIGYHVVGCQKCDACRAANFKECPLIFTQGAMSEVRHGSNAEYIVLPSRQCLPLPEQFDWADGALLACNFGTGYGAVRNAQTFPGDRLGVWGMGPVGLSAVIVASALGAEVIAFEVTPERRALALEVGAVAALDPREDDVFDQVKALTRGRGIHAAIDTSGAPVVHRQMVEAVDYHGRVVTVGLGAESAVGPTSDLILKQLTVVGSWIFDLADWPDMMDLATRVTPELRKLIAKVVRPADAVESFKEADSAAAGKIIFDWTRDDALEGV